MARKFVIKAARMMTTSHGDVEYGQPLGLVETNFAPGDLISWVAYNGASIEPLDGEAPCLDAAPSAGELEDEPQTDGQSTSELVDGDALEHSDSAPQPNPAWTTELKLDQQTLDAILEAGLQSVEDLYLNLVEGVKIDRIGALREANIRRVLVELGYEFES